MGWWWSGSGSVGDDTFPKTGWLGGFHDFGPEGVKVSKGEVLVNRRRLTEGCIEGYDGLVEDGGS